MPSQRLLGEDASAVDLNFEHAAGGFDEFHFRVRVFLADLGRQTGSPGLVVSNDAIFDCDPHS
jgi:hypothetical protein